MSARRLSLARRPLRAVAGYAAALSVVLVLALSCLTSCSAGSRNAGKPPTVAEVSALVQRHAEAVLARSAKRFLHDVDDTAPSRAFRDRQAAQLAALARVPLASWRYTVRAPVTDEQAISAARERYGAPATVAHIELSYALSSVDPAPSVHDVWWTFVRRGDRVLLAGDDDLAQLGGAGWRGPWDFGEVVVARGSRSLVLGHPAAAAQLPAVAAAVDAALPAVTGVWGAQADRQVAVLVPGSREEFAALTSRAAITLVDVSAVTVSDQRDPVTGGITGQRVIVNPAAFGALTDLGRRIVLRHELTHVVSAADTGERTPRWLVEGFAEYVANLGTGQPTGVAAAELRGDVRAGRLPTTLPTDAAFSGGRGGLAQVYQQSWLACRLIARQVGPAGLVRFYRAVGTSAEPAETAVATALHSVLQQSTDTFTAQWRAYLETELA